MTVPPRTPQPPRARRASRRLDRQAGVTLIEVLIAILVFSIGILGLATVIPMGTKRVTMSAGDTHASELAAERAELLLSTAYNDGDLDAGSHSDPNNPRDGVYNISWSVDVDQPLSACKRVTITVSRASVTRSRLVIVSTQAAQ